MSETGITTNLPEIVPVLSRYQELITDGLRQTLQSSREALRVPKAAGPLLDDFYGQIEYHLGWRSPDLTPVRANPGKLLRPTLLLLSVELAAGSEGAGQRERAELVRRAVPAAVSVELIHNFSLVHDDIEDGDEVRRHRPTLWKIWGIPQAINTGDGIFGIARAAIWNLLDAGVTADVVAGLGRLIDHTCVELCEGQYLDMTFERREDVSVEMYLDMIGRKTGALMACATEAGGWIGSSTHPARRAHLATFGHALGLAFQLRDDLLGIWARDEQLGKTAAGDIRRKKMSLPVIHAKASANPADRAALARVYSAPGEATDSQIGDILDILQRTHARERVGAELLEKVREARAALDAAAGSAPEAQQARQLLGTLVSFIEIAAT